MLSNRGAYLRWTPKSRRIDIANTGMGSLRKSDPTSVYFRPRSGDNLTNLLISSQVVRYGQSILPYFNNNQTILMRHAKLLLEKHDADRIKRGIAFACWLSDYPFSFSFVERSLEILEQRYGL